MPAHVLFDLTDASRRIERDGYRARKQNAKERAEVLATRRQHQGDCLTWLNSRMLQAARNEASIAQQRIVGEDFFAFILADRDLAEVRIPIGVPAKHLRQRTDRPGWCVAGDLNLALFKVHT